MSNKTWIPLVSVGRLIFKTKWCMYQLPEAEMVSDIQDHPVQPIFLQGRILDIFTLFCLIHFMYLTLAKADKTMSL